MVLAQTTVFGRCLLTSTCLAAWRGFDNDADMCLNKKGNMFLPCCCSTTATQQQHGLPAQTLIQLSSTLTDQCNKEGGTTQAELLAYQSLS